MTAGGSIGMVLDRALTIELLDVALRIATEHREDPSARQLLAIALRDFVTRQEAENKTKKVLTRVWVVPPADAQQMIEWAIEHQDEFTDRRALHFGALLATFPFFGSIAAAIGRQTQLDGVADRTTVRTHARTTFGEREFIDAAASKSLATIRNLGLVEGPKNGPFIVGTASIVPPSFSSWFLHALILTRQVESVSVDELSRAPEYAGLRVAGSAPEYPLLEIHTEGARAVAVATSVAAGRNSNEPRPSRSPRIRKAEPQPALDFAVLEVDDAVESQGRGH
jgi:hypothetical protein